MLLIHYFVNTDAAVAGAIEFSVMIFWGGISQCFVILQEPDGAVHAASIREVPWLSCLRIDQLSLKAVQLLATTFSFT